jgi:hypothetical protein
MTKIPCTTWPKVYIFLEVGVWRLENYTPLRFVEDWISFLVVIIEKLSTRDFFFTSIKTKNKNLFFR